MKTASQFNIDALETRRLLSTIILSHGELLVAGDNTVSNTITVGLSPDQLHVVATVVGASTTTETFDLSAVKKVFLVGGNKADTITVDETNGAFTVPTIIDGRGGNDTIVGGSGNELIFGGAGNDSITAGNGNDVVFGGPGNDSITVGNGNDLVFGGLGNDTTTTGNGNDTVFGLAGDDTITLGNGTDTTYTGGKDSIICGSGDDTIWQPLKGDDTVVDGSGDDVINRVPAKDLTAVHALFIASLHLPSKLRFEI